MNRRAPFVAPAVAAMAICLLSCLSLRMSGVRAGPPPIRCQFGESPSTMAAREAKARRRQEQDVIGQTMPPLDFDRWLNTDKEKPLAAAGKVTLYRWWTDGCEHCEKTLPAIERLRQKYGPRGLRVVAVYHPKPPREVPDRLVLDAARKFGYDGPLALDLDWSELKKFYLATGERRATSASFLVGSDGVIRFAHPGPRLYPSDDPADAQEDADYHLLEKAIEQLLATTK